MSLIGLGRKWGLIALILSGIACLADRNAASANTSEPSACAAPVYHQFDFWLGNWDVFESGNPTAVAHVKVSSILTGCVLQEEYRGVDGTEGNSFSTYDAATKLWQQSWVTNRGQMLVIKGNMNGGAMVLSGEEQKADGPVLVRGTWKPMKNGVREMAVTSSDGGKTWKEWFDLQFRPANVTKPAEDDKKDVADLDRQYQAAVRDNDAATMDRLLADDFILVTGSGKIYTKADLIEEARRGRTHYERQEDTDQTVRVWGDTAVLTAKLWEKGTEDGREFDYTVWFSDVYVRTSAGWGYVFGQSSSHVSSIP